MCDAKNAKLKVEIKTEIETEIKYERKWIVHVFKSILSIFRQNVRKSTCFFNVSSEVVSFHLYFLNQCSKFEDNKVDIPKWCSRPRNFASLNKIIPDF